LMTTITQVNGRHFGILPASPQAVLIVTEQVPRRKQLDGRIVVRCGLPVRQCPRGTPAEGVSLIEQRPAVSPRLHLL
jgi:hypothetical protein